jgi:hypothetical protein
MCSGWCNNWVTRQHARCNNENKKYWVCICSLKYPAYNVYVSCYKFICSLSGCTTFFPLYLMNSTIFGKKVLEYKMFWFYPLFVPETFLILRRTQLYKIVIVHRFSCNVPVFCRILIISTAFQKSPNIKFHENPSLGNCFMRKGGRADRRKNRGTDSYEEANCRISGFNERS